MKNNSLGDKLKKITDFEKTPYIVLFIIILLLNAFKSTLFGDDTWFSEIITGKIEPAITSFSKYVGWRYVTWSSRLIIEFLLIMFTYKLPILWKILDAGVYVLLYYSIKKVFCKRDTKLNWLVLFLVLCIPFGLIVSAGWVATSLNYIWIISFGIFCLIPIRKIIDGESFSIKDYLIFGLASIFACNSEQVCLCLVTVYLIFNIYFAINKKLKPITIIINIIAILSLIFILTCPGNTARTQSEIVKYFPGFDGLSLIKKVEISIISTMQYYLFEFNFIYLMFSSLVCYRIYKNYKNIVIRIIAIIPIIMGVGFNVFAPIMSGLAGDLYNSIIAFKGIRATDYSIMHIVDNSVPFLVPLGFMTLNVVCIFVSTTMAFGKNLKSLVMLLLIGAGLCTRFMMGFVPSVDESGYRTHLILLICMIICSILVLDEEEKIEKYNMLAIPALINYFNGIVLCFKFR